MLDLKYWILQVFKEFQHVTQRPLLYSYYYLPVCVILEWTRLLTGCCLYYVNTNYFGHTKYFQLKILSLSMIGLGALLCLCFSRVYVTHSPFVTAIVPLFCCMCVAYISGPPQRVISIQTWWNHSSYSIIEYGLTIQCDYPECWSQAPHRSLGSPGLIKAASHTPPGTQ